MFPSHIDSTLKFNKHHRTESGIPFLVDDFETNDDWWSQHEGVRPSGPASLEASGLRIAADIDAEAPAWCIERFEEVREPDMFDEGYVFWLMPDAVVSVEINRLPEVRTILRDADRLTWAGEGVSFTRIHPSQYGIEVTDFEGRAHSAHESWSYVTEAIK